MIIGFMIHFSWTHPKRAYKPTGAALGTIRAAQTIMVAGAVLVVIGLIRSISQLL
jgi:hypothetical protein